MSHSGPVDDGDLARAFDVTAGHLKTIAEALLTEHFGERCPDFDPDCFCCQRWKALDDLTENPYSD